MQPEINNLHVSTLYVKSSKNQARGVDVDEIEDAEALGFPSKRTPFNTARVSL
jgi:hypothetical protein